MNILNVDESKWSKFKNIKTKIKNLKVDQNEGRNEYLDLKLNNSTCKVVISHIYYEFKSKNMSILSSS